MISKTVQFGAFCALAETKVGHPLHHQVAEKSLAQKKYYNIFFQYIASELLENLIMKIYFFDNQFFKNF